MIKLRRLEYADTDGMLEWMHDESITKNFRFNGSDKTVADIKNFVDQSYTDSDQHFAVSDTDSNEYLGTISLKNIDLLNKKAEYAICLRKKVIGSGVAKHATNLLLQYAREKLKLHKIYLNVFQENIRANKFYKKMGFILEGSSIDDIFLDGEYKSLNWYSILLNENINNMFLNVPLNRIKDENGELTIFEDSNKFVFNIKRMFYIKNVKKDEIRGQHANKKSEFLMICLQGSVSIRVTDGIKEETIYLDDKSDALYIPRLMWKDMYDFENNCILMVLSNERYDNNEYIRDFDEYKSIMEKINEKNL